MAAQEGVFLDATKINPKRYAERPALGMAVVDYLLFVERNPRRALDVCAEGTVACGYADWWWKARLGLCYLKLGLLREAESQLKSSLRDQEMVSTYLALSNVYLRLDLPNTTLELLTRGAELFPMEPKLVLFAARVHDMLNDGARAMSLFKRTLGLDASNVEALACLATQYFYADQPEMGVRYFRRLLQMGINTAELWNNLGLCCFYASHFDVALHCFERALAAAGDQTMADVWYNIGHVSVGIGDSGLAYQAFKVAVSIDPNHVEAHNNIGVLEARRKSMDAAKASFSTALCLSTSSFEPYYNAGEWRAHERLCGVHLSFRMRCALDSARRTSSGGLPRGLPPSKEERGALPRPRGDR
jgi:tetratricopeptide repeat protein 8